MEGRSKQSQAGAQEQGTARNKDEGGSRSQGAAGCSRIQRVWELRTPSVAIFCDWEAAVLASNPLLAFFWVFFWYPCTKHIHIHACRYFKELPSLCNSALQPSVVFQMLLMALAPHPTCSCIQLGFNYSLSCKGRFADNIFWGGIFVVFFFFSTQKKPFLLGGERHNL